MYLTLTYYYSLAYIHVRKWLFQVTKKLLKYKTKLITDVNLPTKNVQSWTTQMFKLGFKEYIPYVYTFWFIQIIQERNCHIHLGTPILYIGLIQNTWSNSYWEYLNFPNLFCVCLENLPLLCTNRNFIKIYAAQHEKQCYITGYAFVMSWNLT